MREIVLDTETTGLDPKSGDRIVEIGAIELFNHMPTGKFFHESRPSTVSYVDFHVIRPSVQDHQYCFPVK